MNEHFLNNAQAGRNDGWRYLFVIFISLGSGLAGYVLVAFLCAPFALPVVEMGSDLSTDQALQQGAIQTGFVLSYVLNTAPFIGLLLGLVLAVWTVHGRSPRSLITARRAIDWRRCLAGFAVWFGLASLQTLIEFGLHPKDFFWSFDPTQWLMFLPLALLLTPIQTTAEELLFRGYLLQALGRIVRQPILLLLCASLPFALVHLGNPEMQRGAVWLALTYLLLALFLTGITLKDGRLELALGVHAANNLFIVLVVNTQDSALRSPSIITQAIAPDPPLLFLALLVQIGVFYVVLLGKRGNLA